MNSGVEIIAHRGASADAPENTMAAFRLAWEQGAHAIELDVHLSKDNQVVVIHDNDTKRTTGVSGKVSAYTAKVLGTLDAGSWKNGKWRKESVPMLSEVLAGVPNERRAFIEVKEGAKGLVTALAEELTKCPLDAAQMVLMSLDFDTVKLLCQACPDKHVSWVVDRPWKTPKLERVIARSTELGLQHLCFSREWPLEAEMVERVRDAGIRIYAWTIDDLKEARRLAKAGVNGIITNTPAKLIQNLDIHSGQ